MSINRMVRRSKVNYNFFMNVSICYSTVTLDIPKNEKRNNTYVNPRIIKKRNSVKRHK